MKIVKQLTLCMMLALALAGNANAILALAGPIEWGNLANNVARQLTQFCEQYNQMITIRNLVQKQLTNITEYQYGMGNLMNTANALKSCQRLANNWEDTPKGIADGNDQQFKQLYSSFYEKVGVAL